MAAGASPTRRSARTLGGRLAVVVGAPAARGSSSVTVYHWCMSRTNIDIDEDACQAVMDRYHLSTKRAAVNFALRTLAAEPLDLDSARRLRGSGWDGDLDDMRTSRTG
jgi:Arc/MetJ family transcription regulator